MERIKKAGRWLTEVAAATVLWASAAWMGFNAWDSWRETGSTPLGLLTLGQLGETLFWAVGALVAATFGWAVWEDRDKDNTKW